MNTQKLTFPIDFTEELYDALRATAAALTGHIGADAGEVDRAALAQATYLLAKIEASG
jgi:hypothetical protein